MKAGRACLAAADGERTIECRRATRRVLFARPRDAPAGRAGRRPGRSGPCQLAGRSVEAARHLDRGPGRLGGRARTPTPCRVLADLAGVYSDDGHGRRATRSRQRASAHRASEVEVGRPAARATCFLVRGLVHGTYDRSRLEADRPTSARRSQVAARPRSSRSEYARALGNLGRRHALDRPRRQALDYAQRESRDAGPPDRALAGTLVAISVFNIDLASALASGGWDEADRTLVDALDRDSLGDIPEVMTAAALVWSLRGEVARAREMFQPMSSASGDLQAAAYDALVTALMTIEEGDPVAALRTAREGLEQLSPTIDPFVLAVAAGGAPGPRGGRPRGVELGPAEARRALRRRGPAAGARGAETDRGPAGRGPDPARRRRGGSGERPARRSIAVPPGPGPPRSCRGAARGRQGPGRRHRRGGVDRRDAAVRPPSWTARRGSARSLPPRRAAARRAP